MTTREEALNALARIQDIVKPISLTMQGPRWDTGIGGGGNKERIWRICQELLEDATPDAPADGLEARWHHSSDAPPEHFCEDCDAQRAELARLRVVYEARICARCEALIATPAAPADRDALYSKVRTHGIHTHEGSDCAEYVVGACYMGIDEGTADGHDQDCLRDNMVFPCNCKGPFPREDK